MPVIETKDFAIAGTDHYPDHAPVPANAELYLEREPTNAYDANAISVWWSGSKLGYIPRPMAVILAPMLDSHEYVVRATSRGRNMMLLKING